MNVDGAEWIKAGLKVHAKAKFVLDSNYHIQTTCIWLLNPAAKCAILSIEKGKATEAALPPQTTKLKPLMR